MKQNRFVHEGWRVIVVQLALVYIIPFTHSASVKLPSLFFVIELVDTYNQSPLAVGALLAVSYVTRILIISCSMYHPQMAMFYGTSLALLGFSMVATSPGAIPFIFGTVMTGMADIYSSLQVLAKEQYCEDSAKLSHTLKVQYSVSSLGGVVVFFAGGYVYNKYDCVGVAWIGVLLLVFQLFACTLYFFFSKTVINVGKTPTREPEMHMLSQSFTEWTTQCQKFPRIDFVHGISYEHHDELIAGSDSTNIDEIMKTYSGEKSIAPTWVHYIVAAAASVTAIAKGMLFSMGSLLVYDYFNQSKTVVGVVNGTCAASGAVMAMLVLNESFASVIKKHLPTPCNLYAFLLAITLSVAMTSIPSFAMYAVGLSLMNVFLVLFNTYLTEFMGEITTKRMFKKMAPGGQLIRRCCNVVASFTAPSLYYVLPVLPNIIAAEVCLIFLLILFISFQSKQDQCSTLLERQNAYLGVKNLNTTHLTFSEEIVLSSMLQKSQLT